MGVKNTTGFIVIKPKDYQTLFPHLSYWGAFKRYQVIKAAMGKAKHQFLFIADVANYEGVAENDIKAKLSLP